MSTPEAVRASATAHLTCVRQMFEQARWLVFTLGLTEGWRSRQDGAVYPTAPGVVGGAFDPNLHEFVNFTASEVRTDLAAFVERIHAINEACRIILTVSPVPLIATYEPRHVLVSTCFSKSALRVAADEIERACRYVTYFPSYEIITSAAHEGRYWADDLRQVTDLGVSHAMRVFSRHFIEKSGMPLASVHSEPQPVADVSADAAEPEIVCDEEVIERALRRAGFETPR
jgi:hypothetical protein